MLDKKQIQAIFKNSSSKWVIKQQRQLTMSATHLAQELLLNRQCSGGSRSFVKETRALKMRSIVAVHQKLTMTNWEPSSILILFTTTREVAKELKSQTFYSIQHFKQIRNVKKLYKWVSRDLTTNQKNHCFEVSSSLILHKNNEPFLNRIVTCD